MASHWSPDGGVYPNKNRIIGLIEIIKEFNLEPTFSLLDLACGTGELLYMLKDIFPQASFTGIDIQPYIDWRKEGVSFIKYDIDEYIQDVECDFNILMALNTIYTLRRDQQAVLFTWAARGKGKYFITDVGGGLKAKHWCGTTKQLEQLKNLVYVVVDLPAVAGTEVCGGKVLHL